MPSKQNKTQKFRVTLELEPWTRPERYRESVERERKLKLFGKTIGMMREIRTTDSHVWGEGRFFSFGLSSEQGNPVYKTQAAALRRLLNTVGRGRRNTASKKTIR